MIAGTVHRTPEVAALCERHHVRWLEVFGSAACGAGFGPAPDVDGLVAYEPSHAPPSLGDFPALFGRDVYLIVDGVVRNPDVKASIERGWQTLYGA